MVSKFRRLIADHADLHNSDLPPYYLFSDADGHATDDLSQLSVLLTGPHGTPYADGLWRLHLRIPDDYPASPPKAAFKTRIWHPNVEESTGAVCVDTLKRDWESRLTLRDILVTISCLLIQPNPDSALNSSAGALLQDDYSEFARQAKLMTSIHAPIPDDLKDSVLEAKQRGEDPTMVGRIESEKQQPEVSVTAPETTKTGLVMKTTVPAISVRALDDKMQSDSEDLMDDYKENDPSLSPEPIVPAPPFSRRSDPDKRPLAVISAASPLDTDVVMYESSSDDDGSTGAMTSSERNIAANMTSTTRAPSVQNCTPPETQSQRLTTSNTLYEIYQDDADGPAASPSRRISFGKENLASALFSTKTSAPSAPLPFPTTSLAMKTGPLQSRAPLGLFHNSPVAATRPLDPTRVTKPPPGTGVRKGTATAKRKPRLGLRRL